MKVTDVTKDTVQKCAPALWNNPNMEDFQRCFGVANLQVPHDKSTITCVNQLLLIAQNNTMSGGLINFSFYEFWENIQILSQLPEIHYNSLQGEYIICKDEKISLPSYHKITYFIRGAYYSQESSESILPGVI